MSSIRDRLNSVLARYEGAKAAPIRKRPPTPVSVPRKRSPAPIPTPTPRKTRSSHQEKVSNERRFVSHDLAWDTVLGVKVLVSSIPNYVAVRNDRGEYDIIQLTPRQYLERRIRLKDVMPAIRAHHENDIKRQLREVERQAQSEAEAQAEIESFENNPGFYIVPGETIGPDDKTYNATGPYYRFESIGRGDDDEHYPESYFETDADVEEEANVAMRRGEDRIKIIEARNARDAANGKGHVWWEQGNFRGPPIDPRQRGFGF